MRLGLRRSLALLAGAACTLHLASSLPSNLARAASRLSAASSALDEDPELVRRRRYGAEYVEAIDRIRRALPRDAAYFLVDGEAEIEGGALWVRLDLAPRKAFFLGRQRELASAPERLHRLPPRPKLVVVAFRPGTPPQLFERAAFFAAVRRQHGR